jgi:isoamyl acetate esterase
LCHIDLHYGNLLFDNDYNLTVVLDWSQAQTVPLERLAVSPEFLTFPAATEEANKVILNFRDLTRNCLREAEMQQMTTIVDEKDATRTLLSDFFGTKKAEMTHSARRISHIVLYGMENWWLSVYTEMQSRGNSWSRRMDTPN